MPVSEVGGGASADALLLQVAARAFADAPTSGAKVGGLGLAVSGGSDSMAMLHMMAAVARNGRHQVCVVTLDHGLRPEAAAEAQFVAAECHSLGVPHDTLVWVHGEVSGNLMQQAARARYGLIAQWAIRQNVGAVALAHTASDQAETFVMGLARSAGLDGLSGMRPSFVRDGVVFIRPFLQQTRGDLRGYLTRQGGTWMEDPTNENPDFSRTKARRALRALSPLGITEARLAASVLHLAAAQGVVKRVVAQAAVAVTREAAGALTLDRAAFTALDAEVQRAVLRLCLLWVNGQGHAPRADGIARFMQAVSLEKEATLAGCRLRMHKGQALILREAAALGGPADLGQIWDGRWQVTGPQLPGHEVRALGAAGLGACTGWRETGLPRAALLVTPGVWSGPRLVSAPVLTGRVTNLSMDWSAKLGQSFNQFILSH